MPQPTKGLDHRFGLTEQIGKDHQQTSVTHHRRDLDNALRDIRFARRL